MNEKEVRSLADNGSYNGEPLYGEIEETHISWVILTKKYAFKLKKPVKLSFLDFSTLKFRKIFCEKEVILNSRYTDIYESVVPVRHMADSWLLGDGEGLVVDYAVMMRRLPTNMRMDNMLRQNKVNAEDIQLLALQVAAFHQKADKVYAPFMLATAIALFNDIDTCKRIVQKQVGLHYAKKIEEVITWSDGFLRKHANRFQERIERGFVRDVHGDLHSGNVFLDDKPVIFDCIEFNDQYRQIDVLYEVAFMCMDMEAFYQPQLAEIFLNTYSDNFPCFEVEEDYSLLNYFKSLRANVRAKVHTLSIDQSNDVQEVQKHVREVEKYIDLMYSYMGG
ncbi:phosphotransferase [Fulvivirga sp. 29W222]|uniref:Phosphotransferase n=1 Tax=Fulvivirga marina TaxID=2494733 RepID=A0A937G167_9BACT|nr:phosphotransferase [Fulvivirga marina]MBL6448762.1 phosphotransferase [Fulvivirga marina]